MQTLKILVAGILATTAGSAMAQSINLANYELFGRYALPSPTNTTPPTGSLLAQEASGITYNKDTNSLFIIGDGSTSIVQVSKTGQLINSMTLALGGSPQGTAFYDTEGLAYIGGNQFVIVEERYRIASLLTYTPGTTLQYSGAQHVTLGTTVGNVGLEGMTYDPKTGGYIFVKEESPEGIFQTNINFAAGTATNGSATTTNSIDMFSPALLGLADFADVFALSNTTLTGAVSDNLLVLSQASGKIVETTRAGVIKSTFDISTIFGLGESISVADAQFEGITMDNDGFIYLTTENGGGSINFPQMFVLAPKATAAVPEPASWALMIGGLGLVGAAMRRRATSVRFA